MTTAINPQDIRWTDPTRYEDGTPFGTDNLLGYELGATEDPSQEPVALLTLPTAYGVGYSPIPSAVSDKKDVVQHIALRTVDKKGVRSIWTGTVPVVFYNRPLAPEGFVAGP